MVYENFRDMYSSEEVEIINIIEQKKTNLSLWNMRKRTSR